MRKIVVTAIVGSLLATSAGVAARQSEPVTVTNAGKIRGTQSVVVGSFAVAFITEKTDAAFAGARNNRAGSITRAKLANVDPATFQAITDAAYADFTARMAAAGITIADRGAMLAGSHYANATFAEPGAVGTVRFGKDSKARASYFSPTAFGNRGLLAGEIGAGTSGGLGGFAQSFRATNDAMERNMYAIQSHQPVVNVVYIVDFAGAERYGGHFAIQAAVTVKANLAVVEDLSTLTVTNDKGFQGVLTLAEPVAVGGDFGSLEDTTSGGTNASNVVGGLIAGAFGGNSNRYSNLTFTAAPDRYRDGAIQVTIAANTRLVERLASLR